MSHFRYRAFISYSHADERWAKWLHKRLERYKVPRNAVIEHNLSTNRIAPVFRDRDELGSSSDLSTTIERALEDSENLIVICSPDAAESRWVNEEVKYFLSLGRSDRIFCFVVGRETGSIEPSLVPSLRSDTSKEPLAADARPFADGPKDAMIKIVAGLLSITFSDLKQRELQAHNRRLLTVSFASGVGILILGALLVFAVLARNEADLARRAEIEQREKAEAARRQATVESDTAQKVAEYLEDVFLNIDPDTEGDKVTALELLDERAAILKERHKYEQPEVAAQLFRVTADVYASLGRFQQAIENAELFLDLAKSTYGDTSYEVGEAYAVLADLSRRDGDYDGAIQYAREGLAIQIADPENRTRNDANLLRHLAAAQSESGLQVEAEENYRKASAMTTGNSGLLEVRMQILNSYGAHLTVNGRYSEARPMLEETVRIREELYGHDHERTMIGKNNLGSVYYALEELDLAKSIFEEILDWNVNKYGSTHPETAAIMNNLASIHQDQGDHERALEIQLEVLAIWRESLGNNHPDVGIALFNIGNNYMSIQQFDSALSYFKKAEELWSIGFSETHPYFAYLYSSMAGVHWLQGDEDMALQLFIRAEKASVEITRQQLLKSEMPEFLSWATLQ